MTRNRTSLLPFALLVFAGCASDPTQKPGPEVTISTAAPEATTSETASAQGSTSAPAEAPSSTAEAGGTEGGWSIQYLAGPSGWSKSGPEGETLLTLSGPPGGPLFVNVHKTPAPIDAAGLADWVKAHFTVAAYQVVEPPVSDSVTLAGQKAAALAFYAGKSMARTEICAAVWPVAFPGRGGVVVTAGISGGAKGPASCANVIAHKAVRPVWSTLTIEMR